MAPVFAGSQPTSKTDTETLRWCVRSDGLSAFVFCNNYQRLHPMQPKQDVQFTLRLKSGDVTLPSRPATVAGDSFFIWPVNIDLGGINLVYATAEILCNLEVGDTRYVFFAETAGVPGEFAFDNSARKIPSTGTATVKRDHTLVEQISPSLNSAIHIRTNNLTH